MDVKTCFLYNLKKYGIHDVVQSMFMVITIMKHIMPVCILNALGFGDHIYYNMNATGFYYYYYSLKY